MRATPVYFAAIVLTAACFCVGTLALSATQDVPRPVSQEYQFVEDTTPWVQVIQGDTESLGKLDASGNFIPDKRYFRAFRMGQPRSSVPPSRLINCPQKGVYEFRSGRLIPGDIDEKGNFIPELRGRIIDFRNYSYGPKAAKIYNLPGTFVRKQKKDGKD